MIMKIWLLVTYLFHMVLTWLPNVCMPSPVTLSKGKKWVFCCFFLQCIGQCPHICKMWFWLLCSYNFCVFTENLPTGLLLLLQLLGLLLLLEVTNKDQLYVQGSVNSFVQPSHGESQNCLNTTPTLFDMQGSNPCYSSLLAQFESIFF